MLNNCDCKEAGKRNLASIKDVVKSDAKNPLCEKEGTPFVSKCDGTSEGVSSEGASASSLMDAKPVDSMTLVGRVGSRLARFVGNGFIQVRNGKSYLVESLPMVVTSLFHNWVVSTNNTNAVVGDPINYPFKVIADTDGVTHVVRGLTGSDSVEVYDHEKQVFIQKSLSSFPIQTTECIPRVDRIELTGFGESSVEDKCEGAVRKLKALSGNGLLVLETVSADACCDDLNKAFARIINFPQDDREYYIRFSKTTGIYFEPKTELNDGKSAYTIWLEAGNSGSIADFLASLKGDAGQDGSGVVGTEGKSAYDLWLSLGNVGSLQDFLESLKGQNGQNGQDGSAATISLNVEKELVDVTSSTVSKAVYGQNINGTTEEPVLYETPVLEQAGWSSSPAMGVFVYNANADKIDIEISLLATLPNSLSDPANVGVSTKILLFKNSVLVATAIVSPSSENDVTEDSAVLRYTDTNVNGTASYLVAYANEGSNTTTALSLASGLFTGTASSKVEVVKNVTLV